MVEQRNLLLREIDELQQKVNEVKATRAQHEPEVMHVSNIFYLDVQLLESMPLT